MAQGGRLGGPGGGNDGCGARRGGCGDRGSRACALEKVRRVNPIKLRQIQERLAAVEAEIPRIEGWVAEAEQALGVYVSAEETQRLAEVLAVLRAQQATLNEEWEKLATELEEA